MKTGLRLLLAVLLLSAAIASESRDTSLLPDDAAGWYSWQVAGTEDLRIFARIESGRPAEFLVPSFQCQSNRRQRESLPDAEDLGTVAPSDSIAWLRRFIAPRHRDSSLVMALISAHGTDEGVEVLLDVLRSGEDRKNREDALFWLAQSESEAAFAALDQLLR